MIKDVRNAIFDADNALRDGDIDQARALLLRADALLIAIQQGNESGQGQDGGVPPLRKQATRVAGDRRSTLGGRRRVHGVHQGGDA